MKEPSIKKNYFYSILYQTFVILAPLVTSPYTARVFGADGMGIQSYTASVATYFAILAGMGTAAYGQREIAIHRTDKKMSSRIFWEIELISIAATCLSLIPWFVLIALSDSYKIYYCMLTLTILAVPLDISWYFSGFEQYKIIIGRSVLVKLTGIVFLFLFVRSRDDLLLYIGLLSATVLVGNLSMWISLPRMLVPIDKNELKFKRHIKQTIAYFIPTIATSVYTVLDKTMIGFITHNPNENGYYEQATRIVRTAQTLAFSLNNVMSARMAFLFSENRQEDIRLKFTQAADFILLLAWGMMFGIIGTASNFVPWFFGEEYEKVVTLLYISAPLLVIIAVSNCLGFQYLTPSGQNSRSSKGIVTGAIVNLCCNFLLIPRLGAVGATIASVLAEGTITVIYLYMCKEYLKFSLFVKLSYKKIIAGTVMLGIILLLGYKQRGSIVISGIQVGIGIAIYLIVLLLLQDEFLKKYFKKWIVKS